MPTQEVACEVSSTTLLRAVCRDAHAAVLDGRGPASWQTGRAVFAAAPVATLEVFASGWGRWRHAGHAEWRWGSPLEQWQRFVDQAPTRLPPRFDPDAGGILTVLGYDLKHWIEVLPHRHEWAAEPVLFSALYDSSYVLDHASGRALVTAQSEALLIERLRALERVAAAPAETWRDPCPGVRLTPVMSHRAYRSMIERALEYIAAGDVYQVNLAQCFTTNGAPPDPASLFLTLSDRYPMPFGAYVDGGTWVAVSNSPECFLAIEGRSVSTFPIKGTRKADGGALPSLPEDPKERAEHVMVVDLERNDLGRVCEPGSVEVKGMFDVRSYPLLRHMVSEVRGRLQPAVSLSEVLRATFPGGSITGAPKIRAMQIIEELEPCARGLYTGAIGWTDLRGGGRFSIAIRTALLTDAGLTYFAGGGIVADSDPDREYEETWLKAEAFARALASGQPSAPTPQEGIDAPEVPSGRHIVGAAAAIASGAHD